jgi:ribosome biogenesis GTPase
MQGGLSKWGWAEPQQAAWEAGGKAGIPGRVISQHKGGLFVVTEAGERLAVVPGRLRRAAEVGKGVLPTVGDWVALGEARGDGAVPINAVLPRKTLLARKAAGDRDEQQALAANVDVVLLVAALTRDLNPRRLERALAVTHESGAEPLLVLTKADLCDGSDDFGAQIGELAMAPARMFIVSARSGMGLDDLQAALRPGRTAVLLGSSGVGKSTLVNRWLGREKLATADVDAEGKGRHTTTHRELVHLPWGALVVDTPGLRELGLWESEAGVRETFEDLEALAVGCRFSDCAHDTEPGCAVRAASESGEVPPERYQSFLKLRRELAALEQRKDQRLRAEGQARDKEATRRQREFYRAKK